MKYPALVRMMNGSSNALDQLRDCGRINRLSLLAFGQVSAGTVFHAEKWHAVAFADFINRNDVRVIQMRNGLRFSTKSFPFSRGGKRAGRQCFESNGPIEPQIERFIDNPHSPSTNLFLDRKSRNLRHSLCGTRKSVGSWYRLFGRQAFFQ